MSATGEGTVFRSYRDLIAWQKAMDLVQELYRATARFPDEERFGLVSQARRAAVSIPSTIAEGHGRRSTGELLHHLSIARGSLCELETQILIAGRLSYLPESECQHLMDRMNELGRVLRGLARSPQDAAPRNASTSRPSPLATRNSS